MAASLAELTQLTDSAQQTDEAVLRRAVRQARKHLDALIEIDHFHNPARADTERCMHNLKAELRQRQRQLASEPDFAEGEPEQLNAREFHNRLWATRRNLWVDRLASAWLICRLKGLKSRIDHDDQLLAEGGQLLNDLYAAFSTTTDSQ